MRTQVTQTTTSQLTGGRAALAVFVAAALLAAPVSKPKTRPAKVDPKPARSAGVAIPLSFEENRGQADDEFQFLVRARGFRLMTKPAGALLRLNGQTVEMSLHGANAAARVEGLGKLPGTVNYLVGNDPSQYRTGIPTFAKVRYRGVYDGVDLVYYANERNIEYDFIVAPGANPRDIRIGFSSVEKLEIDPAGDLILHTATGEIRQHKPVVYQELNGERREVRGAYAATGESEVAFELGDYDASLPLVIDPVMAYSTYLGGTGDDRGNAVAVDTQGNAYVVGQSDFGGSVLYAFVAKFDAAGSTVLYTSFIGNGHCNSAGNGIAVDGNGNAIVTGQYGFEDQWGYCNKTGVLASKLNPLGNGFIYSQYLGGTGDSESGNAVAVDTQGYAYLTGRIFGGLPVTAGAFQTAPGGWDDAFVVKLSPAGAVVYATYLAGGWNEEGLAIAVDAAGRVAVGGSASSSDFPVTGTAYQSALPNTWVSGFVSQLNSAGSQLLYSTYLGGMQGESVTGVAVDANGKIYATGATNSRNFPATANAFDRSCGSDGYCNPTYVDYSTHYMEDAFLTKIDPAAAGVASIMYSTFFGGMNRELGRAIAIDSAGRVYLTGRTQSLADFPVVNPIQANLAGDNDVFVAQFDTTRTGAAALLFSTFLGGADYDEAQGMALDSGPNVYVTGYTASANYPVNSPAQGTQGGGYDIFLTKIAIAPATLAVSNVTLNPAVVNGGQTSTGTVTLTAPAPAGGAVVILASNHAAATVPASVTVFAGASTAGFNVTTSSVPNSVGVAISASFGGITKSGALTVNPPVLTSFTLSPVSVTGGSTASGSVRLSDMAPAGGMLIALASNHAAAGVPSSIRVPAGSISANFTVTTTAVTAAASATISAICGSVVKSAVLAVNPAAAGLNSLAVNPAAVTAGTASTGTLTLGAVAPAGGAVITLSSNNTGAATVPAIVTIAAGATTKTLRPPRSLFRRPTAA